MRKWLIVAGFVGAFAVGSMTIGSDFSYASSNNGVNDISPNKTGVSGMMNSNQDSGTTNMMGNMNGMMDTMSMMGDLMSDLSSEAAQYLGMTTNQLQNGLQSGKSLAAISEAQGKQTDQLVKSLKKIVREDSDKFKEDGSLTTDKQKQALTSMSENIGTMINKKGMFACSGFAE